MSEYEPSGPTKSIVPMSNFMPRIFGRRPLEVGLVVLCVFGGAMLRLSFVDRTPLWVDEAESSINALTILDHGYPTDRYLGLPLYENLLLKASPNSEEYEFADSSYSNRGMAIYHAWLPLYSIAASYMLAGIRPDQDNGAAPAAQHGSKDLLRRTVIPRLPSIFFSIIFLVSIYHLGRIISGYDTAWCLLIAAAFHESIVFFGWQARYYSATLAFSALSGLTIGNLINKGRWRDSVATAFALVLLFHTHYLSCLLLAGVLVANLPFVFRHPQWLLKLSLTGAIVALGIVPWLFWTGFFDSATHIPGVWPMLAFPQDFVFWFATRKLFVCLLALALALVLMSARLSRIPLLARVLTTAAANRRAFYFATVWFCIAYIGFLVLIPAASFYPERLSLVVAVPGYLLLALSTTLAARAMSPRFAVLLSPLMVLILLGLRWEVTPPPSAQPRHTIGAFLDLVRSVKFRPGTKLYAWPNDSLTLTYYLGLPVQSIAPVRRSFLSEYSGDIILLQMNGPYATPPLKEVRATAKKSGAELNAEEAQRIGLHIQRYGATQYLASQVADIWPPLEPTGEVVLKLAERYQEETRRKLDESQTLPQMRGLPAAPVMGERWLPLFYRFVNPENHLGNQLNYGERIRDAVAIVLPDGAVIYDCRRKRDIPLVNRDQYLDYLRAASSQERWFHGPALIAERQ